jgi:hypothetical protein
VPWRDMVSAMAQNIQDDYAFLAGYRALRRFGC